MIGLLLYFLLQIPTGSSGTGPVSGNTYTVVQNVTFTSCTSPCAITVASTGSGNLLYVMDNIASGSAFITAVSGGCSGSWVIPGASQIGTSGSGSISSAYCLSSSAAATSITVTGGGKVAIWEYSAVNAPSFDVCGTINNSTSATSQVGVALSLATSSELIIQGGQSFTSFSSLSSPYGHYISSGGDAAGTLVNNSSGAAPTWTMSSSASMVGNACAFK
jgi:hypothetical protein